MQLLTPYALSPRPSGFSLDSNAQGIWNSSEKAEKASLCCNVWCVPIFPGLVMMELGLFLCQALFDILDVGDKVGWISGRRWLQSAKLSLEGSKSKQKQTNSMQWREMPSMACPVLIFQLVPHAALQWRRQTYAWPWQIIELVHSRMRPRINHKEILKVGKHQSEISLIFKQNGSSKSTTNHLHPALRQSSSPFDHLKPLTAPKQQSSKVLAVSGTTEGISYSISRFNVHSAKCSY